MAISDKQFVELYADMMGEIKFRIAAINQGTLGKIQTDDGPLAPALVGEFCFLQLRKICELIALGALLAHGDAPDFSKLSDEWHAAEIIKRLAKFNDRCFPIPIERRDEEGKTILSPKPQPSISKEQFPAFYGTCGGPLHRGTLEERLKTKEPPVIDYLGITARTQKLQDLLNRHLIWTPGNSKVVTFLAYGPEHAVNVQILEQA